MCITEFKYTLLLKTNHHLSLRQSRLMKDLASMMMAAERSDPSLLKDLASMMMAADRARW